MNRLFDVLSRPKSMACGLLLAVFATAPAYAQVKVSDAWARATVPTSMATGAYMKITSDKKVKVVGVESPVAGVAEIHEMKMNGNMMSMRAVPALDVVPGQTLELAPGGLHIMLMDLKQKPLKEGEKIPLKLKVQGADGKITTSDVSVEIRGAASEGGKAMNHGGHTHHH